MRELMLRKWFLFYNSILKMEQWKKELLKLTKSERNDLLQVITLFLEGKFEQLDIKPLK